MEEPGAPTDADYRFWADRFGVTIPVGVGAREAFCASGVPADLADLAIDFADSYR